MFDDQVSIYFWSCGVYFYKLWKTHISSPHNTVVLVKLDVNQHAVGSRKLVVFICLLICLFSSPAVWFYFGVVGSFIFIVIQLILLIDFAHSWNKTWVGNAEEGNSKCWFAGRITVLSPEDTVP